GGPPFRMPKPCGIEPTPGPDARQPRIPAERGQPVRSHRYRSVSLPIRNLHDKHSLCPRAEHGRSPRADRTRRTAPPRPEAVRSEHVGVEIRVEGLTKSFGSQVIWRDVDLTLPA